MLFSGHSFHALPESVVSAAFNAKISRQHWVDFLEFDTFSLDALKSRLENAFSGLPRDGAKCEIILDYGVRGWLNTQSLGKRLRFLGLQGRFPLTSICPSLSWKLPCQENGSVLVSLCSSAGRGAHDERQGTDWQNGLASEDLKNILQKSGLLLLASMAEQGFSERRYGADWFLLFHKIGIYLRGPDRLGVFSARELLDLWAPAFLPAISKDPLFNAVSCDVMATFLERSF